MKMKEFVRQVEALGYEVSYSWGTIYIKRAGFAILDLGYVEEWDIDIDYPGFDEMRWDDKKELMTIVSEYMLTDPKEREEEKRYYVKLPSITKSMRAVYLVKDTSNGDKVSVDWSSEDFVTCKSSIYRFTEQEIKDIDERYLAFKVEVSND